MTEQKTRILDVPQGYDVYSEVNDNVTFDKRMELLAKIRFDKDEKQWYFRTTLFDSVDVVELEEVVAFMKTINPEKR